MKDAFNVAVSQTFDGVVLMCRSCMRGWWRQSASVPRQRRHEETTCVRLPLTLASGKKGKL